MLFHTFLPRVFATRSLPLPACRQRRPDLFMYSDNGQSGYTSSLPPLLRHSGPLSQSCPRFLDDIFSVFFFFTLLLQDKGHYQQKKKKTRHNTYNTTNDTLLILITIQYFLRNSSYATFTVCFFFLQLHTYVSSELYNAEQVST